MQMTIHHEHHRASISRGGDVLMELTQKELELLSAQASAALMILRGHRRLNEANTGRNMRRCFTDYIDSTLDIEPSMLEDA